MLNPTSLRRRALPALVAMVALAASALASSSAHAQPSAVSLPTAGAVAPLAAGVQASRQEAARTHQLNARAGRAGAKLRRVSVAVWISSQDPAEAGHPQALVQRRRSGAWRTVGTIRIPQAEGAPQIYTWRSRKAATLRVTVASLGLVSPTLKVPAAPRSTRSRYYVRKDRTGDGGSVLRVFKGGIAYGIQHAGMEYSCVAGRLDRPWLRLESFDFGGWDVKYRATGSWKRLALADGARLVGGPRTSLSGTSKRSFRLCAAPVFAAVTTDPNGL